jgi:hypothetical protein
MPDPPPVMKMLRCPEPSNAMEIPSDCYLQLD